MMRRSRTRGLWIGIGVAGVIAWGSVRATAPEPDPPNDASEVHERCAIRISLALTGASPTAQMMDPTTDLSQVVAQMLTPPGALIAPPGAAPGRTRGALVFPERFARFFNSEMNEAQGESDAYDSAYHAARYVLSIVEDQTGADVPSLLGATGTPKPWSDVFLAPMMLQKEPGENAFWMMVSDPTNKGVGYFRTTEWRTRYRGNEGAGLKIVSAARMLKNIVGLDIVPMTNAPGIVPDSDGRASAGCRGCHKDGWYALDAIAPVFGTRGTGTTEPFPANYTGLADSILVPHLTTDPANPTVVTHSIKTDKDLAERLVDTEMFRFNTCRLIFKFLYGRAELACEGAVFDKCMAAFSDARTSTLQSAVAAVVNDASFCQ